MPLTSGANLSNVIKLNKKQKMGRWGKGASVKEKGILSREICSHRCRCLLR